MLSSTIKLQTLTVKHSVVKSAILFGVRHKSEAARTALKTSPFEEATVGLSRDKNESGNNLSVNTTTSKPTVNDVCSFAPTENSVRATGAPLLPGFGRENSLSADRTVMAFDEIPCPSLIKWTSKIISLIPAVGAQVTANLARNGILPVRHLLNTYGPVVRLSGPFGGPILLVARPDLLEAVFAEEGKEPAVIGFDSLRHYRKLRRSSSVTISGDPLSSAHARSVIASATAHIDGHFINGLQRSADEFIAAIRSARSPQGEVSIETALHHWAVESVVQATFGQSLLEVLEGVESDVERTRASFFTASYALRNCETGLQLWRWLVTPSWTRLETSLDQLHRVFGKHVWAEHGRIREESSGSEGKPRCILDGLLRTGVHPDAAISAIVELLLVAGNSIACAAGMLLYELARHPRDQRTVFDELRSALPSTRSTFGDLPKMDFLDACIKETLRLHPPVPTLSRVLPRAAQLHQYHVPQGTVVVLAAAHCARRPDQFEDADRFKPRRWLEDDPGRHPFAGLPWGGGARACPAASIAAKQVAILTAKTVRSFHIEHEYGEVRLSGEVLARPSKPLRLRFVDRTN